MAKNMKWHVMNVTVNIAFGSQKDLHMVFQEGLDEKFLDWITDKANKPLKIRMEFMERK